MAGKEATLLLKIRTAGEESLKSVRAGIEKIGQVGLVAFGALSAVVVKSLADYRQQEEATNSLTQAMINNGTYSKALRDEYLGQASALQKLTLFGDESIIAAQASFAQQAGGVKITKEMTMAILDFAQAQKIDAVSAANLVGKSIGTATNALTRYGIEVNTAGTESEKAAQVMEGLNKKFGGQAVAATDGLGALKQLSNAVSDIFEVIGERLAPVINLVSKAFISLATDSKTTGASIDGLISVLQFASRVGTSVAGIFALLGDTIGIALGSAIGAVEAAMAGRFSAIKGIVADGYEGIKQAAIQRTEDTNAALLAIDQAFIQKKQENEAAEAARVATTRANAAALTIENETAENTRKLEAMIAQQEIEMGVLTANEEQKHIAIIDAQIKTEQEKLSNATTANEKMAALQEIHRLNELKKQEITDKAMIVARDKTLATIAGLQSSGNQALAAAGKAAGLMQIAIATPVAVAEAVKWGTSVGGPPGGAVAAGLTYAAMAAQAAKVAGVQLAEGGIVRATPGGIQATIGEGGQDEAVIPLDRAGEFGLGGGGGNITINVMGGMLGDERSAHQLAVAIDQQLLKLRQNGESVAFDERIS